MRHCRPGRAIHTYKETNIMGSTWMRSLWRSIVMVVIVATMPRSRTTTRTVCARSRSA